MRTLLLSLTTSSALLGIAACSPDKDEDPGDVDAGDTDGPVSETPLDAAIALSTDINTVAFVTWTPPDAGTSWVEYGLETLDLSTPHVPTGTESHEQVLLGMKADRTYSWRAVTEIDGIRHESPVEPIETGTPPAGVGIPTLTVDDRASADPANWLLTISHGAEDTPATVVIYDRDGDPVWYWVTPSDERESHTARPGWDGRSILYGFYDQNQVDDEGGIYRIGMDGRSEVFTPTVEAHHDFVERRDGTLAYLTLDYRDDLDVEGEIVNVVSDAILETDEGVVDVAASPPREIYNQFDDSGQALYWTCSDMRKDFDGQPYKQWSHANSLMPDPVEPDRYYWTNYRYQDSLLKIDRDTHAIAWQIGGVNDDSDLLEADAFDHGHMSHFWPGGFLMFDNNTHEDTVSYVREYEYDEATKHVSLVQSWSGREEAPGMADARMTTVDTVLVNWKPEDIVQEITRGDEVVWELDFTGGDAGPSRLMLLNDLYELDDPYAF
ncbi:MAG: aryl-sulfate sulfotransferase [Deltaproteobacteria bacterium]|nr:aryl-sulfate sulfotransferase [Deltaproteobacteria bacterium]